MQPPIAHNLNRENKLAPSTQVVKLWQWVSHVKVLSPSKEGSSPRTKRLFNYAYSILELAVIFVWKFRVTPTKGLSSSKLYMAPIMIMIKNTYFNGSQFGFGNTRHFFGPTIWACVRYVIGPKIYNYSTQRFPS
jgi:hypothetical protein